MVAIGQKLTVATVINRPLAAARGAQQTAIELADGPKKSGYRTAQRLPKERGTTTKVLVLRRDFLLVIAFEHHLGVEKPT